MQRAIITVAVIESSLSYAKKDQGFTSEYHKGPVGKIVYKREEAEYAKRIFIDGATEENNTDENYKVIPWSVEAAWHWSTFQIDIVANPKALNKTSDFRNLLKRLKPGKHKCRVEVWTKKFNYDALGNIVSYEYNNCIAKGEFLYIVRRDQKG